MKQRTRNDYLRRIDRAIALLEQAVARRTELPELSELARAAHFSPCHFHRIYRALAGETVGHTAMRLRLLRALQCLADGKTSVTAAALAAGYETPQGFARALRQALATSPGELRAQPAALAEAISRLRSAPAREPATAPLRVEVVSLQPFSLLAMRHVGDYEELDRAYARLFDWAASRGMLERLRGIYGVPGHDRRDTPAADCVFDCALAFEGEPAAAGDAAVRPLVLGGGRWLRLRHVGPFYPGLDTATDALLAEWLPESGLVPRDAPLFHHYLDDPEEPPAAALRTDIYFPVAETMER
jgi:AraC family transcriptional regulator